MAARIVDAGSRIVKLSLVVRRARRRRRFDNDAVQTLSRVAMGPSRRSFARWRRDVAIVAFACLTLAFSCSPDETLQIFPEEGSITVPQGVTQTVALDFELPTKRNLQSVTLPADVEVVGNESDIPSGLSVSSDPATVTIGSRGTSVPATLTVEVAADTALGNYFVAVRPSSTAKHLDTGSGLRLTVIVVQGEAPLVTIASPQAGGFVSGDTLAIAADVSDGQNDFDSWEIRLDGNSVKTGTASDAVSADADISGFEDGSAHTVEVTARDTTGHTGTASAPFTIDRGAPQVAITAPEEGAVITGGGTQPITGTASDPEDHFDHFELKLDDQLLTSGTTPGDVSFDLDTSTVSNGEHTISLGAIDRAGNLTVVERTITVDHATPEPTSTPG